MIINRHINNYMFLLIMLLGILLYCSSCKKDEILILGPTKLLKLPDDEKCAGNIVIKTLEKGSRATIFHVRYSKDYMFYKVKTLDGNTGYVMHGDDFMLITR